MSWSAPRKQALTQQWRCYSLHASKPEGANTFKAPKELAAIVKQENSLHFAYTSESQWVIQTRSTLRAILRECSYLPDPNARQYMKKHTIERFQTYSFKAWKNRSNPEFGSRLAEKYGEARQWLSRIERANEGDRKALLKILLWTYGRAGKRRHLLMEPLMPTAGREEIQKIIENEVERQDIENEDLEENESASEVREEESVEEANGELDSPDPASDSGQATDIKEVHDQLVTLKKTSPGLSPELLALAKSQMKAAPPTLTRRNPRRLQPAIPERNTRLLPMPQKRVKNMTARFYAKLLNTILPPIPTAEYMQLSDWARGKKMPEVTITRRKPKQERLHFGRYSALEAIVIQGRIDAKTFGNREAHNITPRFMQRLWATVLSQCCRMTVSKTGTCYIHWGHLIGGRSNTDNEPNGSTADG